MQFSIRKILDYFSSDFTADFADTSGATAIEYGLIAALIAVAAIAAMQGLGDSLKGTFNSTSSSMSTTSA